MKIAIVDDDCFWQEKIKEKIEACFKENAPQIRVFSSGEELLRSSSFFEAVFLDVEMDGMDGFDAARAYEERFPQCYVLILTLHAELSRKGYLVNAFRYIDKQYMEEEIPEALYALGLLTDEGRTLSVRVFNEGILEIPEKTIICAETIPHGVLIHCNERSYRAAVSIGELAGMLDRESFFRSHNSWIVNWKYVEQLSGQDAVMKNGIRAMVSQKQISEAKKRYWEYKFNRARG